MEAGLSLCGRAAPAAGRMQPAGRRADSQYAVRDRSGGNGDPPAHGDNPAHGNGTHANTSSHSDTPTIGHANRDANGHADADA